MICEEPIPGGLIQELCDAFESSVIGAMEPGDEIPFHRILKAVSKIVAVADPKMERRLSAKINRAVRRELKWRARRSR